MNKLNNFKPDIINVIEQYMHNIQDGNTDFLQNLKIFITNLKNEYLPNSNSKVTKSTSQISMVDIEMIISDERNMNKEIKNSNFNQQSQSHLKDNNGSASSRQLVIFKERSTNTDDIITCEKGVQAMKVKVVNSQEKMKDINVYKSQYSEVQQLIELFMENEQQLMKRKDQAHMHATKVVEYLHNYFASNSVVLKDVETQTNETWYTMKYDNDQLIDFTEPLEIIKIKNNDLEEKILSQSHEISSQCEIIDELTKRNSELSRLNHLISQEIMETKDMNEFLQSENQQITLATDKLQDDFQAYVKLQDAKVRDHELPYRTAYCQWSVEEIRCKYEMENIQRVSQCLKYGMENYKERLAQISLSLNDYLNFDATHSKLALELQKKIDAAEKILETQKKEKEIWEPKQNSLLKKKIEEEEKLKKNVITLNQNVERLDTEYKAVRSRNDFYRDCFSELRKMNLNSKETSSHNEIDLCREILSKYESILFK